MRCCDHGNEKKQGPELPRVVITGWPNVGKSVLFNQLTGRYVTVSNYPGTTVEVSRGKARLGGEAFEVIDTPGMYTFTPINEEEKVARDILIYERPFLVIHVVEAVGLERMLPFTLQLIEASLPAILVLNMMDEAENVGIGIDAGLLEKELGIPVMTTAATTGRGIEALRKRTSEYAKKQNFLY